MLDINKVYNLDCLDFLSKIDNESIDLIVVDPPYNLHKFDYGNKSDFQEREKYEEWCRKWFKELARVLKNTGSLYCWISKEKLGFYQVELNKLLKYRNTIIWNFRLGANYIKQKNYGDRFEACLFFTKGDDYTFHKDKYGIPLNLLEFISNKKNLTGLKFYKNNPKKAQKTFERFKEQGKLMVNIWDDIGHIRIAQKVTKHLNEKPVKLIDRIIKMSSNENDLVLDCFGGSGTTYISCLKNKRNFIGCELEKEWYNKIALRIKNYEKTYSMRNI